MIPGFFAAGSVGESGPALWTPYNMASQPKVWLDDQSSVSLVGSAISQWSDRSVSGWDATQSTPSRRPTIVESAIGGRRALRFSQSLLQLPPDSYVIANGEDTIWSLIVSSQNQPPISGYSTLVSLSGGQGFTSNVAARFRAVMISGRPGVRVRRVGPDALVDSSADPPVSGWNIKLHVANFVSRSAEISVNGGASFTQQTSSEGASAASNLELFLIGDATTAPTAEAFAGDIAAVLVGSGEMPSQGDIDKLFGWAAWHYGLEGNLPIDHPYKDSPPSRIV